MNRKYSIAALADGTASHVGQASRLSLDSCVIVTKN